MPDIRNAPFAEDIKAADLPPEVQARACRLVSRHARDLDDERDLLDCLGLQPWRVEQDGARAEVKSGSSRSVS